jgi:hypothetical protein
MCGLVSLINLIDQLTILRFPGTIQRLVVVSMLERESSEPSTWSGLLRVDLDSIEILALPLTISFGASTLNRIMVNLPGLTIGRPGILRMRLFMDGNELASTYISVSLAAVALAAPVSLAQGYVPPVSAHT